MTNSKYQHLTLDLGSNGGTHPALAYFTEKMERRTHKVRSAYVFTSNGTVSTNIDGIFQQLSTLPNLKHLRIHLSGEPLSLQSLCLSLNRCLHLKTIVLQKVHLINAKSGALNSSASSKSLQEITLLDCHGTSALRMFFSTALPKSLRKLTLANTPIGLHPGDVSAAVSQLPKLKSLRLWNVPYLDELHIQHFFKGTQLTTFELVCDAVATQAGKAVMDCLRNPNSTIEHLRLFLDWEGSGHAIANMLRTNQTLTSLDVRTFGLAVDSVSDAILIARSLQNNNTSALQKLRLCLETEPNPPQAQDINAAFESTLETNHTLKHLELHDSLEGFALPLPLESKLRLNRSGVPKLWESNKTNYIPESMFVEAICNQNDDLNTIYTILRNEPTLCCGASNANSSTDHVNAETSTDKEKADPLHSYKRSYYHSILKKKGQTKKLLKSMFANNNTTASNFRASYRL